MHASNGSMGSRSPSGLFDSNKCRVGSLEPLLYHFKTHATKDRLPGVCYHARDVEFAARSIKTVLPLAYI